MKENLQTAETTRKPRKEIVGSKAFNLEYDPMITDTEVREDVVSYLNEYRLKKKSHSYSLLFSNGEDGLRLRDIHRKESMLTKAKLAIDEKKAQGRSTKREEAEFRGIIRLENQLREFKGGTIVWAGPPGDKEEGYGDYGFIYFGKVEESDTSKRLVSMTAFRVENPSLAQFNHAFSLLTGESISYSGAEEFLENPRVFGGEIHPKFAEKVIKNIFDFNEDKEEKEEDEEIIEQMNPMINDFTHIFRKGTNEQKILYFHALENYALKLKKEHSKNRKVERIVYIDDYHYQKIQDIVGEYGYKPPTVTGSCGNTDSESNDIFSSGSLLNGVLKDKYGSRAFKCSSCGRINIRPKDEMLTNCQHCNSTEVACDNSSKVIQIKNKRDNSEKQKNAA